MNLDLNRMSDKQIIIGLIGEPSSGKDTVAKYLEKKYGAKQVRFSDPLSDALLNFVDSISREDYTWLSHAVRERFGQDVFAHALRKRMQNSEIIVLNGVRFWENFDFVRSFEKNVVIYVTADAKLRWKRATERMEKSDDNNSFEKFQELEKMLETEVLIPQIGEKADFTIRNEADLEHLLAETDKVMAEILQ